MPVAKFISNNIICHELDIVAFISHEAENWDGGGAFGLKLTKPIEDTLRDNLERDWDKIETSEGYSVFNVSNWNDGHREPDWLMFSGDWEANK